MAIVLPYWIPVGLLSIVGVVGPIPLRAQAAGSSEIVAVYSSASPDYTRARQPGGSFKPETYAFGKGGAQDSGQKDPTFDQVGFVDVAHLIAPSLASQKYVPCNPKDPRSASLLIMVYWGTTIGTDGTSSSSQYQNAKALIPFRHIPPPVFTTAGTNTAGMAFDPRNDGGGVAQAVAAAIPQAEEDADLQQSVMMTEMANRQRDRQDRANASILGYLHEMQRVDSFRSLAVAQRRLDVIDELEESRYYVVLLAYDFQLLWQHKQRKLLWETRFSVRERRNDFGKVLASMAQDASRYFGQSSDGLIREHLREPRIILGEPSVVGYETATKR
jgi:hypothetical protein